MSNLKSNFIGFLMDNLSLIMIGIVALVLIIIALIIITII